MSEQRVSDSALCRRIAEGLGWTDIYVHPSTCRLYGYAPGDRLVQRTVPQWDTDPTAHVELMESMLSRGWEINCAKKAPPRYAGMPPTVYVCLANWRTAWPGEGLWFAQAFARAAAAALESEEAKRG